MDVGRATSPVPLERGKRVADDQACDRADVDVVRFANRRHRGSAGAVQWQNLSFPMGVAELGIPVTA